ncbi:uncharacterized protein N7459_001197 [Penicillium hispanicum]|uniref:uncharacterized protein n=1 Tax=Penicillium hispanicum TaxID=1080232 RepID=UPI002541C471|nr:uncharacterized protein N7459_001197 [Penicillium hispanicum]KAJ5594989.1 hypothetical protein N7459_001197 [Penicillium hispanicum]
MSSQLDPSKPDRHPDLCLEPIWDVVGPMLEFPLSNATWGHLSRIIQARDEFRTASSLDFARELFQRWIELLDDPGFIYPDFEALLSVIEEPTPDNALVFDEVYECQRRFVLTATAVFNLKRQCLDQELANGDTICAICHDEVPLGTKVTTTAPVSAEVAATSGGR